MTVNPRWVAIVIPSENAVEPKPAIVPNLCAWNIGKENLTLFHTDANGQALRVVIPRAEVGALQITMTYLLDERGSEPNRIIKPALQFPVKGGN